MSFPAKYRGECVDCEGVIEPGEEITRKRDCSGYSHAVCPDLTPVDLRPGERVCASCFTVHVGECM